MFGGGVVDGNFNSGSPAGSMFNIRASTGYDTPLGGVALTTSVFSSQQSLFSPQTLVDNKQQTDLMSNQQSLFGQPQSTPKQPQSLLTGNQQTLDPQPTQPVDNNDKDQEPDLTGSQESLDSQQQPEDKESEPYLIFEDMMQGSITFSGSGFAQFRCIWTICALDKILENIESHQYIQSKQKVTVLDGKVSFRLVLNPIGDFTSYSNLDLYLYIPEDVHGGWIALKTAILDDNGKECNVKISQPSCFEKGSAYNTNNMFRCSKEDLSSRSFHLLVQGTVWETAPSKQIVSKDFLALNPVTSMSELHQSGAFSDFKISFGGEVIPVHKSILAAKSPVFRRIFQENCENVILQSNISSGVFREVLNFIYTDTITPTTENNLSEVLKAAHEYGLAPLKEICQIKMCENISDQNVVNCLQIADEFCAYSLKERCFQHITNNKKAVTEQQSWKIFLSRSSDLLVELLSRLMEQQ